MERERQTGYRVRDDVCVCVEIMNEEFKGFKPPRASEDKTLYPAVKRKGEDRSG